METVHMSMAEIRRKFIGDTVHVRLAEAFPQALKKHIPRMPRKMRHKARKEVKRLKKNPMLLYEDAHEDEAPAGDAQEKTPVDTESASYKSFIAMCESIADFFDDNSDEIIRQYKQSHAEMGITLIIE